MSSFFLVCAGLGGVVLILQVVLSMFGLVEDQGDMGPEEGLDLLSVRALSAGCAFFGLGGLVGLWVGLGGLLSVPLGLLAGGVALVGTAKATRALLHLESDRTPVIEEAIGEAGTVYLPIPGQEAGMGKVHVSLRGRLVELSAITREDTLPTGSAVQVVDTVGETLVVVPLSGAE